MDNLGLSSKTRVQKMEENDHKIEAESLVEAELDLEIRGLLAGDERRGSIASQSNGRCVAPVFLHSFLTSGTDMARQQLAFLQNEFGKTYGMQHQPAPVDPVHVTKKRRWEMTEETKMRRSTGNQLVVNMDRLFQGAAMVFGWFCFWMLPCPQGITLVKAMETSSIHLEKEMEVEADRSARRKIEMKAEMRKKDPLRTLEGNSQGVDPSASSLGNHCGRK